MSSYFASLFLIILLMFLLSVLSAALEKWSFQVTYVLVETPWSPDHKWNISSDATCSGWLTSTPAKCSDLGAAAE